MSPLPDGALRAQAMFVGLTVNDLDRSIRFYTTLGFEIEQRWESDGQLRGVMLRAGQVQLALGQDDWKKGRNRVKGTALRIWVTTDQDLDQLAERARRAGVADARAYDAPWGSRVLDLVDPDGFALSFSAGS
jgi:catechol 2,3-dioxygenase-like lactoylglutathione lyase family enzyme